MTIQKQMTWVLIGLLTVLAGCMTPADKWLADNLKPQEKADLLVDQGILRYNAMVDADDLAAIPKVKLVFQTALTTDPLNTRAADYLKKVTSFVSKRQTEAQAKAKTLSSKASLSDKEKYSLVVLVQQLQLLAPPNFDLTKLTAQVAPIRIEVLQKATQALVAAEKTLASAKTDSAVSKALSAIHNTIQDIRVIDPTNAAATGASQRLTAFLTQRNKADLDLAKAAYKSKDYPKAAKALTRVDQALASVGTGGSADIDELQYRVYFDWAKELFGAKKLGEAAGRVNDALGVKLTSEARDLKEKITAAASVRDFDAEWDSIDKQFDALIKDADLKAAWDLLIATQPQLKKDDNLKKASNRKKQILDAAHALYDASVASYNEEDYQEAKLGFDAVVAIDPAWQLVKAYQEKAKAKLQALGGN